jgi:hypothetical protein
MRYAATPLERPQCEGGVDYGHGRRTVLVRNGDRELLHVAGAKHWSGVGMDRSYSPAEIALWHGWTREPGSVIGRQETLLEGGRFTPARLASVSEAIYEHLGIRFPLDLIDLRQTLLLDEPGTIDRPPARRPRADPTPRPRVRSAILYQVVEDPTPDAPPFSIRVIALPVLAQKGGKVTVATRSGERRLAVDRLAESGIAETAAQAAELFIGRHYARAKEAEQDWLAANRRRVQAVERLDGYRDAVRLALALPPKLVPENS